MSTRITGVTVSVACSSGRNPMTIMAARIRAGMSGTRSADDASGIAILHVVLRLARTSPHPEVMSGEETPLGVLHPPQVREVNPGNGWMLMMREMPVVIQPQRVERRPDPEIPGAFKDMSRRAEMMNVLHGRPRHAESRIHDEVVDDRNGKSPDDCDVQGDRC